MCGSCYWTFHSPIKLSWVQLCNSLWRISSTVCYWLVWCSFTCTVGWMGIREDVNKYYKKHISHTQCKRIKCNGSPIRFVNFDLHHAQLIFSSRTKFMDKEWTTYFKIFTISIASEVNSTLCTIWLVYQMPAILYYPPRGTQAWRHALIHLIFEQFSLF